MYTLCMYGSLGCVVLIYVTVGRQWWPVMLADPGIQEVFDVVTCFWQNGEYLMAIRVYVSLWWAMFKQFILVPVHWLIIFLRSL